MHAASARRPNCTCSFPACSFREDSTSDAREASERARARGTARSTASAGFRSVLAVSSFRLCARLDPSKPSALDMAPLIRVPQGLSPSEQRAARRTLPKGRLIVTDPFSDESFGGVALILLRLCGGPSVELYRGRVPGLAYVDPNFMKTAVGTRGEDNLFLLGSSVGARAHNIDCLFGDVRSVGEVAGIRTLDLP